MKILVTGGAGFIGSHIVESLLKKKQKVVVLDNLSSGKKSNLPKNITCYKKDIRDNLDQVFSKEKPQLVIHTAAQVKLRDSLQNPLHDASTNILGTINILEHCRKYHVKKIIYTSTGGARYGHPNHLPVKEEDTIAPLSPYGISKHTAEHYIIAYHALYGLDYLILCFGNVYGPRDDPSTQRVTAVFIDKMLKGQQPKIFGDGKQTRDFIFVEDLADCIASNLATKTKHKLFNLANGKQVSVNHIFSTIKNISGLKGKPIHVKAITGEVKDIYLDISIAKKELNWKPRHTFEQGVKKTFDWFSQQK